MGALAWGLLGWVGFDAAAVLLLWRRGQVREARQMAMWHRRRHWHRWASRRRRERAWRLGPAASA